jgi:hypothetical protein
MGRVDRFKLYGVVWVSPKSIIRRSPIAGCGRTRSELMCKNGYVLKDGRLSGNWDKTAALVCSGNYYRDMLVFLDGKESCYNWKALYDSIRKYGYVQQEENRYVEVAIGRTGDVLLVDGRHRLLCAQLLDIKKIPVAIAYVHEQFKGEVGSELCSGSSAE